MTVETNANFLSDLNKAYPRNRDLIKEGDDHIRLLKAVLQNTFPGMDSAVVPTSEKLNKLDGTFSYEESALKINNSVTLAPGKDFSVGGAVIEDVGDPKKPTDAVNLQSLQGSLMWPIGSIFMTVDARNPSDILGFGNWDKFAAGRVIMGTGTTSDINNVSKTFVNEAKGGEFAHTILEEEVPEHTHKLKEVATNKDGAHRHAYKQLQISSPSPDTKHDGQIAQYGMTTYHTETDGDHSHKVEGGTDGGSGKGKAMSIIQPYIACNIWVRKS